MNRQEYEIIEKHMLYCMQDSAHDKYHIYRVLYATINIAKHEKNVDYDVLISACFLHDIGRKKQFEDLNLCHAQIGADMAFEFLLSINWNQQKALHVKDCISSHRYRGDNQPQSIEAKILFDADKLDATGAMGIARTLLYEGQITEPLYILDEGGNIITDGGGAEISSFFQEYNYKLKKVYDTFYTEHAKQLAAIRQKTAMHFYDGLYEEISKNYNAGMNEMADLLRDS